MRNIRCHVRQTALREAYLIDNQPSGKKETFGSEFQHRLYKFTHENIPDVPGAKYAIESMHLVKEERKPTYLGEKYAEFEKQMDDEFTLTDKDLEGLDNESGLNI